MYAGTSFGAYVIPHQHWSSLLRDQTAYSLLCPLRHTRRKYLL